MNTREAHRCRLTSLLFCGALICVAWNCPAVEGQIFQAPLGPDSTWNIYESVSDRVTWQQASTFDGQLHGTTGRLVTIQTAEENALVEYLGQLSGERDQWIGATDREGAAPPVEIAPSLWAPQESNGLDDPRRQGWAWVSGEPFAFTNWEHNEPIDHASAEDAVVLLRNGQWNDVKSGFGVNQPTVPVWQPETSNDEPNRLAPYVIEYPTASPTAWPDIEQIQVPPKLPLNLPGIDGAEGTVGVTDLIGNFEVPNHLQLISKLMSDIETGAQGAEMRSGQYAWTDMTDPDGGRPNGGPTLSTDPFPMPSDEVGADRNVISIAKGQLQIPTTGIYTFHVHSRDSFAMRIGDAPFLEVFGNGEIDGTDPRTLLFNGRVPDSETLGVIQLEAGVHDFRFLNASPNHARFWEVTSAVGRFTGKDDAQWLPVGRDEFIDEKSTAPTVKLTQPARVVNVDESNGGRVADIDLVADVIELALEEGRQVERSDVETVVLRDYDDDICCDRPGADLELTSTYRWPISDLHNKDNDFFSSAIFGELAVDDGDAIDNESILITVGMFSNEGARLHIEGASFIEASRANLSHQVGGDTTLTAPGVNANTDAFGLIELSEGVNYRFEAYHFEGGLDAGFGLWTAEGDYLGNFDPEAFSPLSLTLPLKQFPANQGLLFVAKSTPDGDYNEDGILDAADLALQTTAIEMQQLEFDENGDGVVDAVDRAFWIEEWKFSWIGDSNLDGEFNSGDLVVVLTAGTYEQPVEANWSSGDWNGDRRSTTSDFVFALAGGGYEQGPRAEAVPEPVAMGPQLLMLATLIWRRNQRTN